MRNPEMRLSRGVRPEGGFADADQRNGDLL